MADTKMVDAGSSGGIKEAGTKEPIFSLAWDCDDLIRECLFYSKVDESTKVRMEDYERRFNAWWEYLGVFAERKGNLDYRLIHQPEIRDIVLRLLLILKRNLTELKVCQKSNGSSYVPPQRVDPAPGPKNAEDVMDIDDLQSLMALCLDAIDESLVELGQVGMAIRQSSRTTEIVRARRFASEHQDLSSFEALTFLALETLYPNAPESLITQLSRNMVDRHSRLLLRASRHNALKKDIRRHAPNLATDDSLAPSGSRPNVDNLQYAQRIDTTSQSFNIAETQYIVPPTIAPTSLYLDKFHRKLNEPQAPRSRMGTTVILQRTPEPPVPHFDGNGEAQCRWCFSNIRQNLVKDGRWSSLGREHYLKDLEPFFCLSEDCAEIVPTFSSIKMWKDHMLQHHRNWSQYIHWQLMWRCNLECEDWPENPIVRPKDPMHQSEVLFSTPGHLCGHVRALHGDIWDGLNDNSATDFIEKSTIDVPRKPNICPLCYFIPKGMESLDDHSDETAPVPTAMVNHIVEHLQNLMILSIRLIGIQNEEVDCDSEGGSMVPMESPQGSQLDHSEEHSNLSELSSPPIGSPPFRMETFALGYDQPPEADDQAWSTIVEETRRQKPESDIYTDPILDALRNHPQMQNLHYVTEESHVLERPETPPSPLSTVPFPRNTNFVGRKSLLDQIHEKCSPAASFIALVGPGGVGKSQLAIEYSCQIREQSPETWVFWISAFSAISIEKSYREIADRVKITGRNDPRTDILTLVYRWLSNQERKWILILDGTNNIDYLSVFFNVLSESAFKRDPPRHSNSSIIMTTQSKDIALSVITQADLIEVGPMDEKDALTLVNGALGIQENREDAIELIKALDFIPLAIVQAAAHLRRKGPHFSISELLETLRGSNDANKLKIFEYKKEDYPWGWGVHESIMRTWQRSFENMQEIRPSAAEILSYMSFFDPHNIPRALVRRRSEICAEDFLGVSRIPKLEKWFTYGLQMLFDLSFISSDSSVGDFNMSRLVQLAMQEWLKADRSFDAWHSAYITDLNAAFPTPDDINWKQCRLLYPHVKSVMTHDPSEVSCHEWDSLLYKGASYALREKILVDVRAYVSRASDLRAKVSINRAPPRVYKASFELVWARNDQWNTLGEHLAKAILDENVNQSVNKDSVLKLFFTGKNKYTNEVAQKFADAENARSTSLGPKGFPKLFKVSLYQQVIYCDDSSSMKLEDRWNSQKELVKQVTKITTRFLPKDEGVALRFINQDIDNSVNLSLERVENILESMLWDPRGDSQIGTHLKSKILQPLVYRKLESRCLGRPLLVSVFTDGIPSNEQESTFTDAILECGDMLENAGYRRGSVRFMVGQIGTENSARMFLENMRHNVAIAKVVFCISDPLDTVLREYDKNEEDLDGWLSETLFSSIWDGKDEDEDYQLIPTWPW